MARLGVAIVAGMLVLPLGAWGAERWPAEQNHCGEEATTVSNMECLKARTKVWDGRLNQVWKELNASLATEPRRLAALKAAEQAWIKFRDANCDFQASQEGTIRMIAGAYCMLQMTQGRAVELSQELGQ